MCQPDAAVTARAAPVSMSGEAGGWQCFVSCFDRPGEGLGRLVCRGEHSTHRCQGQSGDLDQGADEPEPLHVLVVVFRSGRSRRSADGQQSGSEVELDGGNGCRRDSRHSEICIRLLDGG